MNKTREYKAWCAMKRRCSPNNHPRIVAAYRARGITVCPEWLDFNKFLADMGQCPPGKSLGRINNDLGYSKENCRWETPLQQANNKRDSNIFFHLGERKTIAQWARFYGISRQTIWGRLRRGLSFDQAVSTSKFKTGPKQWDDI